VPVNLRSWRSTLLLSRSERSPAASLLLVCRCAIQRVVKIAEQLM
jgi:hypothetical protein